MDEIEELNVEELYKSKKVKKVLKRTVLGTLSTALAFSLIPNLRYAVALHRAKKDAHISEIMESDSTKEEKINEIFSYAITGNNSIPDNLKQKIVSAFSENVINPYGNQFTDKTIYNMYAVASTEKVRETSTFAQKHGWWSGDYNSYFNFFTIEDEEPTLIAHEQLHAILKTGLFGTGYTPFIKGYGLNEGATSYFVEGDKMYGMERYIVGALGLTIGFDKVFKYYLNSDFEGLMSELANYVGKEESEKLIKNLNDITFNDYYLSFKMKNGMSYDMDEFETYRLNKRDESLEIIKDIFKKKYGCSLLESNRGKMLNAISKVDEDSFDENYDSLYCYTEFNGKDSILFCMGGDDLKEKEYKVNVDKEDPYNEEVISEQLGIDIDELGYCFIGYNGDGTTTVFKLEAVKKIKLDEIDDFDFDKFVRDNTKDKSERDVERE